MLPTLGTGNTDVCCCISSPNYSHFEPISLRAEEVAIQGSIDFFATSSSIFFRADNAPLEVYTILSSVLILLYDPTVRPSTKLATFYNP